MNLETFVAELRACAPSLDALRDAGLDDDDIESVRSDFDCGAPVAAPPDQTLRSLVTCWNCKSVQIGGMGFASELAVHPRGLVVADYEGDPVIEQPDGQVVCENHDDPGNYSFVGRSAEPILDCLILTARFNARPTSEGRASLMKDIAARIGGSTDGFWEQIVRRTQAHR